MTNARIEEIVIPAEYAGETWTIAHPRLKLALKYGLTGPWRGSNWSREFDAHTARRGPGSGLPTVTDLLVTRLMNSGVTTRNMLDATDWLCDRRFVTKVERVRAELAKRPSLLDATPEEAALIGRLVQHMRERTPRAGGIAVAKAFKWLSAWAPAHVPMIDNLVWAAIGYGSRGDLREAMRRFQALCVANRERLDTLRAWLNRRLRSDGSAARVTTVRVLDSLIWFDWMLESRPKVFARYLVPSRRGCHRATAFGERCAV